MLVNFVKLAKIAISPVLGKGFAEFEVAFTNPSFQRHARLKISMSPRVMSQQLTASESKERGELYSDGRSDSIGDWAARTVRTCKSLFQIHMPCSFLAEKFLAERLRLRSTRPATER